MDSSEVARPVARKQALTVEQATFISGQAGQLRTIVIDLTPVLPGGENGGAKVFVLELLRRLAERAPETQFVLLTKAAAHKELGTLDRANIRRVMVVDHSKPPGSSGTELSSRLLRLLPERP